MPASSRHTAPSPRRVNSLALYLMSLAAMIGLYSLYARFLVPAIEGPPNITQHVFHAPNVDLPPQQFDREKLSSLFPQDAWELGTCKVLATDQGLILFKQFQRVDGGYLEVLPFTLITKTRQTSNSDGVETPTVLRCSKGAKLKFDKPEVDPLAGKSSLESAWLVGRVDIYRPTTNLEKDDSIEILTSNVQLDERQIFTIDEVQFAFGDHRGSGRQLSMEFAHQQDSLNRAGFETIAGFKRIELAYLERLSLSPKSEKLLTKSAEPGQVHNADGANGMDVADSTEKVEITCSGPFVLDLERKTATFNDQVSVLMEGKTKNEILCKRLTVHFQSKDEQTNLAPDRSNQPQSLADGNWDLKRLIAEGSPATFLSQSHAAKVSGDVLGYNVELQEIVAQSLPGSTAPVNVVTPEFQFEAIQVAYKLKPQCTLGKLGELIAKGPGTLLRPGNELEKELFVSWKRGLSIEPDQSQHLITVDDDCLVRFDKTTEINSQKMQIWLNELQVENSVQPNDPVKPSSRYQPDRMLASGNVEMMSPQLNGKTERLVATWIATANANPGENQQATQIEATTSGSNQPKLFNHRQRHLRVSYSEFPSHQQDESNSTGMQPIVRTPAGAISELQLDAAFLDSNVHQVEFQEPAKPLKRYSFFGDEIDVKLVSDGKETAVQDLTATGNVTLSEIADGGSKPNVSAMTIHGNRLRYVPQENETSRVLVTGDAQRPAMVMTEQFRLMGDQINFDQLANKLWVEGVGEIELSPQSLNRNAADNTNVAQAAKPNPYQTVRLSWASGMVFNGRKIYFEDNVKMLANGIDEAGNSIQTSAQGQGVSLELNQNVDFRNTNRETQQQIEVREVIIVNQVAGSQRVFNLASAHTNKQSNSNSMALISHKTTDPNGIDLEQQQFQAQQVTLDVGTGAMNSKGPGILTHHGKGEVSLFKVTQPGADELAVNDANKAGSGQGFSLIRVNFDGTANANVKEKRLLIQGNVRTVYANVASFDQTIDPDQTVALPDSAVKIKCDRLDFSQWTPRESAKPVQELLAAGNSHVTSGTFEATADQIRYNQANDTLVVEGTARSNAQLWYQPNTTAKERQHLVAQKILYRPGDRSFELQMIKNMEMNKMNK